MNAVNEQSATDATPALTRRQKAARTRTAIIEAAHAEFTEKGYHATTMAAIARRAGVAVQTVYFVFGTKANLLGDVIGAAVMGLDTSGEFAVDPEQTGWFREASTTPSGHLALRLFVEGGVPIFARAAAVSDAARVAAQTDPDAEAVYRRGEDFRRIQFRRYVVSLADRGLLRAGLEVDRATDILTTLFGDLVYLTFTVDRDWSDEDYAEWLIDALSSMLLAPPSPAPPSPAPP